MYIKRWGRIIFEMSALARMEMVAETEGVIMRPDGNKSSIIIKQDWKKI
jgi:hypothetical protein